MAGIKNIIFDLGGVLINIDYNKTKEAFIGLGVVDFENMYAQFTADELFEKLETGQISEKDFYKAMNKKAAKDLEPVHITEAWNAMLLDFRTESFAFLDRIKHTYRLFLLSNTNIIHKSAFDKIFREKTGLRSIDSYFEKAYYSHLIGLRKPNNNIFDFVLQDAAIDPGETLFIDDSTNNIEAARKIGIQTYLLRPAERIEQVLPHLI